MPAKIIELNSRFGRLVTISQYKSIRSSGRTKAYYPCICDCGKELIVESHHLRSGHTISCGCAQIERTARRNRTHGLSHTAIYKKWSGMLRRCTNPKEVSFPDYGGRGISVCPEWKKFKTFHQWALESEFQEHLTIERIDTNGNYEPANCKWIPSHEQARNKRNNRYLTAFGETKIIADWVKDPRCQVSRRCISLRVDKGYSHEAAISTPNLHSKN